MASSAERAAKAMEKGASAASKTASSMKVSASTIAQIGVAMSGMMVGLATKFAARHVDSNSALGAGLEYGGNMLTQAGALATAGAALGPKGAIIGAAAGAVKGGVETFLDRSGREGDESKKIQDLAKENRKLIDTLVEAEKRTSSFRDMLKAFGDETKSPEGRLESIEAEISKREERARELLGGMKAESGSDANKESGAKFKDLLSEYNTEKTEINALKTLLENLKSIKPTEDDDPRGAVASDALSRIGGDFIGSANSLGDVKKINEQQLSVLKKIEEKTGAKGAKFS
jgi:chromosome segregation ATPase